MTIIPDPAAVAAASESALGREILSGSRDVEPAENKTVKVELHIPVATIVKVLLTALVVYLLILLMPIVVTLFLATMLAVTLYPILEYLKAKGLPAWVGVSAVAGSIVLGTGLIFTMILPPLFEQSSLLVENLPQLKQHFLSHIPASGPLHNMALEAMGQVEKLDGSKIAEPLFSVGQVALGGFTEIFLVLIFTIYLLTDGPRALNWILAFFSAERREKLTLTAFETSKVISAYVAGQGITCLICGIYAFIVLSILKVPAALMLAIIAGIFDILPVLGFFLSGIPALLLAMTVSPLTGLLVAGLFILYHAIENYFLIPKIYGNRLRLSDLVVLVSLLAAGTIGGIIGAIVILPLVASYPIIERIWLVNILGKTVVKKHAADEKSDLGSSSMVTKTILDSDLKTPTYT